MPNGQNEIERERAHQRQIEQERRRREDTERGRPDPRVPDRDDPVKKNRGEGESD